MTIHSPLHSLPKLISSFPPFLSYVPQQISLTSVIGVNSSLTWSIHFRVPLKFPLLCWIIGCLAIWSFHARNVHWERILLKSPWVVPVVLTRYSHVMFKANQIWGLHVQQKLRGRVECADKRQSQQTKVKASFIVFRINELLFYFIHVVLFHNDPAKIPSKPGSPLFCWGNEELVIRIDVHLVQMVGIFQIAVASAIAC